MVRWLTLSCSHETAEICEKSIIGNISQESSRKKETFAFFRKASLALIRKMVHYSSEVLLREVCDSETGHNLPTVLVEITATVLDQEVHSSFPPPPCTGTRQRTCFHLCSFPLARMMTTVTCWLCRSSGIWWTKVEMFSLTSWPDSGSSTRCRPWPDRRLMMRTRMKSNLKR